MRYLSRVYAERCARRVAADRRRLLVEIAVITYESD